MPCKNIGTAENSSIRMNHEAMIEFSHKIWLVPCKRSISNAMASYCSYWST